MGRKRNQVKLKGVIFVKLIFDKFGDNHFFPLVLDKNNGERKKKRENKNTCEYERWLFQKLSKSGCLNIISLKLKCDFI